MEWLNQIPVDLNGGFISLGILLCSMAIISWIVFWIGKWDRESLPENKNSSTEARTEQVLMKEMTEMTLTDALHHLLKQINVYSGEIAKTIHSLGELKIT